MILFTVSYIFLNFQLSYQFFLHCLKEYCLLNAFLWQWMQFLEKAKSWKHENGLRHAFSSTKLWSGLLSVGIKICGKASSSSGKHSRLLEEIEVAVGEKTKLFSLTVPSCQHFKKVSSLFVNSKTRLKLQTNSKNVLSFYTSNPQ